MTVRARASRPLGYFKDVDIKPLPGSQPDRTVLQVAVTEQSTGELQLGAGYSSTSSFVGQFSYTERNLFGRGQYLRASIEASSISKEAQISFTEPYFMDRPLAAGVDIYKIITDYQQVDYQGDTTALGFRMGFPTSEFGSVGLRYTISDSKVSPFANAPTVIQEAAGSEVTSAFGYSYTYNTSMIRIKPRTGYSIEVSQDFAGFGGNTKYFRTLLAGGWHHPVFWDELVNTLSFNAGYIQGWNGEQVRLIDRFYKGGDTFRGFALAGVGPREISSPGANAIGADAYAIGTEEFAPSGVPPRRLRRLPVAVFRFWYCRPPFVRRAGRQLRHVSARACVHQGQYGIPCLGWPWHKLEIALWADPNLLCHSCRQGKLRQIANHLFQCRNRIINS